eukprot:CAMPEP_0181490714 /NCGR_PEP_ID=MMETSP1110-20121109/49710_1 /TAXON_ID=174948 /ORGANISM="Symbiodinium sp., Strain CCMP421" /LENGTH=64 /DNA_ID=CAMNT_0023617727 /DNA_START=140 /DNA_END=331 /DNA_ORIENTATION=+
MSLAWGVRGQGPPWVCIAQSPVDLWSPQGAPSRHVEGKGGLRCRCCRHLPTPPMVVLPDFTEGL